MLKRDDPGEPGRSFATFVAFWCGSGKGAMCISRRCVGQSYPLFRDGVDGDNARAELITLY